MSSSTTTYRKDYIPPLTGNKLMKALKDQQAYECELFCKGQCTKKYIPKLKESEWTGIGPMGRLIDPRIIPFEPTADDTNQYTDNIKKGKCAQDENNKYIEMVRTCFPHIYERWYNWPKYKWQKDIERNKTIYQLEYTPKTLEDDSQFVDKGPRYKTLENIMEQTVPPEAREHYQPFNINFSTLCHMRRSEHNYGPYLLSPEPTKITEYMANISRTGCIIKENDIHNHQKICKTSCMHKLQNKCKNF